MAAAGSLLRQFAGGVANDSQLEQGCRDNCNVEFPGVDLKVEDVGMEAKGWGRNERPAVGSSAVSASAFLVLRPPRRKPGQPVFSFNTPSLGPNAGSNDPLSAA